MRSGARRTVCDGLVLASGLQVAVHREALERRGRGRVAVTPKDAGGRTYRPGAPVSGQPWIRGSQGRCSAGFRVAPFARFTGPTPG